MIMFTELGIVGSVFGLFGLFFGIIWLVDLVTNAEFDWFPPGATVFCVSIAVYILLTQEIVYV